MHLFLGGDSSSDLAIEKQKSSSSLKKFIRYLSRRCSRSSDEDFIHPSHEEPSQTARKQNQDKLDTSVSKRNTYFLSRSQQDELRRNDSKSLGNGNGRNGHASRTRSHSNPIAGTVPFSRRRSSTSDIDNNENRTKLNENNLKLEDSEGSAEYFSKSKLSEAETSASTITSQTLSISDSKRSVLCCDKCDGKHKTDDCPYYKKKREVHIDAQKNGWKLVGGSSNLPGATLRMARIVPQAGDGSCLFHSMSYGLKDGSNASTLRRDICTYIKEHPETPICKTPLSDWVQWDSGINCTDYARRMKSGWGGGIEMACMSRLKGCNVHVYESQKLGGFKRISAFDHPVRPEERTVVRVLYRGGVHYDALVKLI